MDDILLWLMSFVVMSLPRRLSFDSCSVSEGSGSRDIGNSLVGYLICVDLSGRVMALLSPNDVETGEKVI
jgi:hypothetical protein